MARVATLDRNEAAFLAVLNEKDPDAENWWASWAICDSMKAHGADPVGSHPDGALSVARNLARRKLVDKQPGRSTKLENGFSINQKGKDALAEHDFSDTKD